MSPGSLKSAFAFARGTEFSPKRKVPSDAGGEDRRFGEHAVNWSRSVQVADEAQRT